ncbi:MAG: patatin-like phospholipase family protein [Ramlibacter sp.]
MSVLRIYAGPKARLHIERHGLSPGDVGVIPGAAGGPKGLILGALDRFIFGDWMSASSHPVHLVGASIGAWRMATACLDHPTAAFERLQRDYIAQDYELEPGRQTPTPAHVSERFGESLRSFYGSRVGEVLGHPRYLLHIVTSRGRHVLGREHRVGTPLGYVGAFLTNSVRRKAMGAWLERVVFSSARDGRAVAMPFATTDYRTRQVVLTDANFSAALQASCSIPFVLNAVHDIPGAPRGAYWDGGITDYHLHLNYNAASPGIVLYPHFQKAVVPGWLDKAFKWRHGATHFLDNTVVIAPDPDWVKGLPGGKLPDRSDFPRFGSNLQARVKAWTAAAASGCLLADEFKEWLARPAITRVEAL